MTTRKAASWPLPHAKPEDMGFSAERLARIRPALKKFIDDKKVPNLVTIIVHKGKVVHYDAQGYMDFDSKKPVNVDTIFRLYSNTKPITGVGVMMMYEDGLIDLDDPVSKYIPAFKDQVVLAPEAERAAALVPVPTVPAKRGITVRDCLRNTTGLAIPNRVPLSFLTVYRDILKDLGWFPGSPPRKMTFKERVEIQAKLPLAFQPGSEFEYHVGYPVVGVVMETILGRTLEDYYQERIFRPLGMKDTSFYIAEGKASRFPACYAPRRDGQQWKLALVEQAETSEKVTGPREYFGAGGDMGGVLSTVGDYARFAQMLLNGGELDGVRILGRKTVEMMTASHTGDIFIPMVGHGMGFGMGVGVDTGGRWAPRNMQSVGSFGWGGAAGTWCFIDPKEQTVHAIFTQVLTHQMMPGNTYQETFARMMYQSLV